MLTNDSNFNGKKQTFVHKICNFVIKFLFLPILCGFAPTFIQIFKKITA